jgi:hypothetical protein
MEVASLSPVPVGVLTWNSPDPCVTIIVKATFDIEPDGSVSLVPDQPPMSLDQATPEEGGRDLELHGAELFYGTDFAPKKAGVDVLAVGHARAPRAGGQIPFRLRVGDLDLDLVATTDEPSREVALTERRVRRVASDPSTAVRLAPANSSVTGWVSRTVAPGFDFAVFNTAPHRHRLSALEADAIIYTASLLRRGDRPVRLAGVSPRVFHVEDRGATAPGVPVSMDCDTLWLDSDREHITLVWRGQVPRSKPGERPFVVVKLHGAGELGWRDMSRRLSRAAWFDATEPHELRREHALPPSQSEPTLTALSALDALDAPESTTARLAKRHHLERRAEPPETARAGMRIGGDDPGALGDGTLIDPDTDAGAPPFDQTGPHPPRQSGIEDEWQSLAGETVEDEDPPTMVEPTPFSPPPSDPLPLERKTEKES